MRELREGVNVRDFMEREKLVRRLRKMREEAVLDRNTILHLNRTRGWNFSTEFEDTVIAFCDGRASIEDVAAAKAKADTADVSASTDNPRESENES
jgi:hypothetical protein